MHVNFGPKNVSANHRLCRLLKRNLSAITDSYQINSPRWKNIFDETYRRPFERIAGKRGINHIHWIPGIWTPFPLIQINLFFQETTGCSVFPWAEWTHIRTLQVFPQKLHWTRNGLQKWLPAWGTTNDCRTQRANTSGILLLNILLSGDALGVSNGTDFFYLDLATWSNNAQPYECSMRPKVERSSGFRWRISAYPNAFMHRLHQQYRDCIMGTGIKLLVLLRPNLDSVYVSYLCTI